MLLFGISDPLTILVIDDHPIMRDAIASVLQCIDAGADPYIEKTAGSQELYAASRSSLAMSSTPALLGEGSAASASAPAKSWCT